MTKKLLMTVAIVLAGMFNQLAACDCPGAASVSDAVKSSDIVVTAKILSKETITAKDGKFEWNEAKYTILVLHKHKGKFKNDTVAVVTGMGGGDCGYHFETGKTYIIYASHNRKNGSDKPKEFPANAYRTSICTRTVLYNEKEFQELKKQNG
ncbi:MAG: hypothetical protein ACXVNR_11575 [Bacteroidia bacterium]